MATITKSVIALVLAVVIGGAIWGAYQYPKAQMVLGSPTGAMFGDGKVAATNYSPATSAASTTSMLNTDGSTRYITDEFASCSGVNGQGSTFTAATTTVAGSTGLQGNINFILNAAATTTTSSTFEYVASSTEGVLTYTSRLWPANTNLTFLSSATNAGLCTVGVHYLAS